MNYRLHVFNFFVLVLFSNFIYGQNKFNTPVNKSDQTLTITGKIPGLQENEPVLLLKYFHPFVPDSWKPVDTAYVSNGKFVLKNQLTDGPRLLMLDFQKHRKMAVLVLGNENVTVTSNKNIDDIPNETIFEYLRFEGSNIANDFLYLEGLGRLWTRSTKYISSSIEEYPQDSTLSKEKLQEIVGLIKAKALINMSVQVLFTNSFYAKRNAAVCELFTECYDSDKKYDSLWTRVYNNLDEETKNSYYGKLLGAYVHLFIGQPAPDFVFNTQDNKSLSLKKVVQLNKCTLLHFWSTSSQPKHRLKFNKELLNVYRKYHSKGLEILNVSLDANPEKWKKAIEQENIPGIQTCDFKEEEGEAASKYKQEPKGMSNILIDQNGKIVAWDLEGAELLGYLYNIFQE